MIKKHETIIGENGIRLSGGEKQDINSNFMLKKTPIILLDEATSS